ncbi:MAG: DUF1259 domain-containing protein [Planctomycetes bacterium]|nr:DUF1259 domain-containing protein [Planctomycetota bacterium]MBI3843201.1 DUF1259 domain-containing protein [Planctomycetota bacterium]
MTIIRKRASRLRVPALIASWFCLCQSAAPAADKLDTAKIEEITGAKGTLNEAEGVFKVSFPRTDVKVKIDGNAFPAFMGLTSWAAFQSGAKSPAMVMGDLVLFEDEVNPVMSAALDSGLTVTALHNHFFFDDPKVFFMHIGGEGTAEKLATGVRNALGKVKEIRTGTPDPTHSFGFKPIPTPSTIAGKPIEEALHATAQIKDGMVKAVFGRSVKSACGCNVGKEMGINTWAAFSGGDDHAIVCGDFACFEGELQSVLKSLRSGGINIVAIHNHMEDENPRLIFLHYWGVGATVDLARTLRHALDLLKEN